MLLWVGGVVFVVSFFVCCGFIVSFRRRGRGGRLKRRHSMVSLRAEFNNGFRFSNAIAITQKLLYLRRVSTGGD